MVRRPLEEEWLRRGALASPGHGDFGQVALAASWRGRWAGAGLRGAALSLDRSALQPQVDPLRRGRAWLEGRAWLFAGDLSVRLRGEVEGVGPRESEETPARRLAGYQRFDLSAELALGDAVLVGRALNLADRRVEQVWRDEATGQLARSPGREYQIAFTWRLLD